MTTEDPAWPSIKFDNIGLDTGGNIRSIKGVVVFTLLWTTVIFLVLFGVAGLVALGNFWKHKLGTLMFLGLLGFGVLSGAASGAISGYALSLVYSTANFTVPTWIPLAMAFAQGIVVIIASYSEIGLNSL